MRQTADYLRHWMALFLLALMFAAVATIEPALADNDAAEDADAWTVLFDGTSHEAFSWLQHRG